MCRRQYTSEPLPLGYDDRIREQAIKLYLEGDSFRRIGRILSVNHQSVANWANSAHTQLPADQTATPAAQTAATLEMDELFTFVGTKKSPLTSSRSSNGRHGAASLTPSARSARRK